MVAPILTFNEYLVKELLKRVKMGKPVQKDHMNSFAKNLMENVQKKSSTRKRYYYIKGCVLDGFKNDHFIIDFGSAYGVDFDYIEDLASKHTKRLRIKETYLHDISHELGNFYSRIAKPDD